jgi:hypothetical protein
MRFILDRPEESRALLLVRHAVADGSSIVSTWALEPRRSQMVACSLQLAGRGFGCWQSKQDTLRLALG